MPLTRNNLAAAIGGATLSRRQLLAAPVLAAGLHLAPARAQAPAAAGTSGTIDHEGASLFWRSEGQGEPLLLIAGWSCDHTVWDALAPLLAQRRRVIRLDNRGIGRSRAARLDGLSVGQMASDAAAVLRALEVRQAHVVGHSMGGQIAQELALRAPRQVATLSLLSTWLQPGGKLNALLAHFTAMAATLSPLEWQRMLLPWMLSEAAYGAPAQIEGAAQALAAYPLRPSPQLLAAQARAIAASSMAGRAASLRLPVLVAVGEEDALTPAPLSRALAAAIDGASLKLLPGAHGNVVEAPEAVAKAMEALLGAHRIG